MNTPNPAAGPRKYRLLRYTQATIRIGLLTAFVILQLKFSANVSAEFIVENSMNFPRYNHTATLLSDGRVLVAAGTTSGGTISDTAEIYNPATRTWIFTGPLNARRSDQTATKLSDGRVLMAGGAGSNPLQSVEIYNPATGAWTAANAMTSARYRHAAVLLQDGRVFVSGGLGSIKLNTSEIYNPATGFWTTTGSMQTPRLGHTATVLQNGKVLVVGGFGNGPGYLASAEIYNPATGLWASAGTLSVGRAGHTTSLLTNGKVLVTGGSAGDGTSSEIYDPVTGLWTATGSMSHGRSYFTGSRLQDGRILVAGAVNAEIYSPTTGAWTGAGLLKTVRQDHRATVLSDGRVLITGGSDPYDIEYNQAVSSVEIFRAVVPFTQTFDYCVFNYVWATLNAGSDLDTRTAITNPILDLSNSGGQAEMGWARNMNEYPLGSATPFLDWISDDTSSDGRESSYVDFVRLRAAYPTTSPLRIRCRAFWFADRLSGDIKLQIRTYLGGSIVQQGGVFVGTGTLTNSIDLDFNVTTVGRFDQDGEGLGVFTYNPATKTGSFALP